MGARVISGSELRAAWGLRCAVDGAVAALLPRARGGAARLAGAARRAAARPGRRARQQGASARALGCKCLPALAAARLADALRASTQWVWGLPALALGGQRAAQGPRRRLSRRSATCAPRHLCHALRRRDCTWCMRLDIARSAAHLRQQRHLWSSAVFLSQQTQCPARLRACCLRRSPHVMHIDAAHCGSTGAEAGACQFAQLQKRCTAAVPLASRRYTRAPRQNAASAIARLRRLGRRYAAGFDRRCHVIGREVGRLGAGRVLIAPVVVPVSAGVTPAPRYCLMTKQGAAPGWPEVLTGLDWRACERSDDASRLSSGYASTRKLGADPDLCWTDDSVADAILGHASASLQQPCSAALASESQREPVLAPCTLPPDSPRRVRCCLRRCLRSAAAAIAAARLREREASSRRCRGSWRLMLSACAALLLASRLTPDTAQPWRRGG